MKMMIAKMRADFAMVVANRIDAGVWSNGDEVAAAGAIRRAIDSNDEDVVLSWSRWLAKLALQDLLDADSVWKKGRTCDGCRHLAKAGDSVQHCAGRAGLAKIYGKTHPLSVLPSDGAMSCARYAKAGS